MRIVIWTAILLAALSFAFSPGPGRTDEPIKSDIAPFGGLRWDDGMWQAVGTVGGFDGLETFKLCGPDSCMDLNGIGSRDALAAGIREVMKKKLASLAQKLKKNPDGADCPLRIEASPVLLADVPFQMKVDFCCAAGFAEAFPERTLEDTQTATKYPLVLQEVSLCSDSPTLTGTEPRVRGKLCAQYRHLDRSNATIPIACTTADGPAAKFEDTLGYTVEFGEHWSSFCVRYVAPPCKTRYRPSPPQAPATGSPSLP